MRGGGNSKPVIEQEILKQVQDDINLPLKRTYSPVHLILHKFFAFTLAEVLITLGIIGVVAALTIPSLIANHRNTQLAVQAKKVYSTISQAVLKAKADYSVDKVSDTDILNNVFNKRGQYLNVVKTGNTRDGGFPEYSFLNGTVVTVESLACKTGSFGYCSRPYDILNDGSLIIWDSSDVNRDVYASAIVDVNGIRKPNQIGRDVFYFAILNDGRVLPYGTPGLSIASAHGFGDFTAGAHNDDVQFNDCDLAGAGIGCAARLMQNNWKMDY